MRSAVARPMPGHGGDLVDAGAPQGAARAEDAQQRPLASRADAGQVVERGARGGAARAPGGGR